MNQDAEFGPVDSEKTKTRSAYEVGERIVSEQAILGGKTGSSRPKMKESPLDSTRGYVRKKNTKDQCPKFIDLFVFESSESLSTWEIEWYSVGQPSGRSRAHHTNLEIV